MYAGFVCEFDVDSGQWQIVSPSGHVLYEAPSCELVCAVFHALCLELQEEEDALVELGM